jgi:hypothetical protein
LRAITQQQPRTNLLASQPRTGAGREIKQETNMVTQYSNRKSLLLSAMVVTALFSAVQAAEAGGRGHVVRENRAGGVTAAGGAAHQGPNGGAAGRGRIVVTDGQGNAAAASGGAFKTPNGARGARGSKTTVNSDGTVTHSGAAVVQGARGTATTQGSTTRNADGSFSGGRTTSATGANGNSATSSSTWDSTNGYNREATCMDAAGNTIACRR